MTLAGFAPESIRDALLAENGARCRPPLTDSEVRTIASNAAEYPEGPPWVTRLRAFTSDDRLTPADRLVLLAIVAHADSAGTSRPGYRAISRFTGQGRSTIAKSLRTLTELGRIDVVRRNRRLGNVYRLSPEMPLSVVSGPEQT